MWAFCLNSLFREYGWQFFTRIALPHPLKTARAFIGSGALDFSGEVATVPRDAATARIQGAQSIVGVGFCLKPIDPPCPSGRPNHDCHYLEHLLGSANPDIPAPCRQCAIGEIGTMTLKTGAAFYIMTSAKDILLDVFVPAIRERRFSSGLFALCRYSLQPFAVGLLASGVRAWMVPFEKGDCRDYATWLEADRGIKEDRTEIKETNHERIRELLRDAVNGPSSAHRFERRGNVLYAQPARDGTDKPADGTERRPSSGSETV